MCKEPVENKPHINADTHARASADAEGKAHSGAICASGGENGKNINMMLYCVEETDGTLEATSWHPLLPARCLCPRGLSHLRPTSTSSLPMVSLSFLGL